MRLKSKQLIPVIPALAAVLIGAPAVGARAETTASLPQLTGFHQIVVDSLADYVFLSEGPDSKALANGATSTGALIVTDLAGNYVATVDNGDGVEGLELSSDGKTLYASLAAKHAVAKIDVSTITPQTSTTQPPPTQTLYPLGNSDIPVDLAMQSGDLWVSYNSTSNGVHGAVAGINISAPNPVFTPIANVTWGYAPEIAGNPNNYGVLVAAMPGLSSSTTAVSLYVGNTPVGVDYRRLQDSAGADTCGNMADMALTPNGWFIPACSNPLPQQTDNVYDGGFYLSGSYATTARPNAIAIASNNAVMAMGGSDASGTSFIYLYSGIKTTPGGNSPLTVLTLSPSETLASRGLAWPSGTSDTSKLYAVEKSGSTYSLRIYDNPLLRFRVALSHPGKVVIGKQYTVEGKVTLVSGAVPPAGTEVRITRTSTASGSYGWIKQTAADGTFSVSENPWALGTYTYTATAGGNTAWIQSTTATGKVTVTKRPVSLRIATSASTVRYDAKVKVTAHLGTTYNNRTVSIYARTVGSTKNVLLKRGSVNSSGYLTVSRIAPHSTVFSAVFTGDPRYQSKTITRTVGVHVMVAAKTTGYYTTMRSGGRTFHVYHHTAKLKEAVAVTPNKHGQCVRFQEQEFRNGSWRANTLTNCGYLNKYSKTSGYLILTSADQGYPYRVRVDYLRESSDQSNLSTAGSWFYFTVRK